MENIIWLKLTLRWTTPTSTSGSSSLDMDINLVTHIISGALNELSIYIAKTSPINKKDLYITISKLLKGFKIEYN